MKSLFFLKNITLSDPYLITAEFCLHRLPNMVRNITVPPYVDILPPFSMQDLDKKHTLIDGTLGDRCNDMTTLTIDL